MAYLYLYTNFLDAAMDNFGLTYFTVRKKSLAIHIFVVATCDIVKCWKSIFPSVFTLL